MAINIGLIANTITSGSNEVFLRKLLRVLAPLSNKIYVISNWTPSSIDDKVIIINSLHFITQRLNPSCIVLKAVRLLLIQLIVCINLLTSVRSAQIILVFHTNMVLPIFCAKLTNRKIVFFAASKTYVRDISNWKINQITLDILLGVSRKFVFKIVDRILVESIPNLIQWLNLENYSDKISLGSLFVDTYEFFPSTKIGLRNEIVGYIGTLLPSKGVIQFVNSIPIIIRKYPDTRFLIVGSGPCYKEIRQLISDYNLNKKIDLKDWIPNSEVASYIAKLKLLILPSESEGLPNIILEAMASGTPVIATAVGGIPDVIFEKETGFLLKNNSSEAIAEGIICAFTYSKLAEISRKARNLIEKDYSLKTVIERYRCLFVSLF